MSPTFIGLGDIIIKMSQTVFKKEIIFHSPMFQKMYYGFPIPILINSKMHTGNNPKNIFQYLLCYIVQYSIYVPQNNRVIDFQLQLAHRIPFVMLTNAFRFRFFLNCCNILANCKENFQSDIYVKQENLGNIVVRLHKYYKTENRCHCFEEKQNSILYVL